MIFLAKDLRQRFNTISFLIFLFIIILLPIILFSFSFSSFLFIFIYWKVLWRMERHFSRSSDPMKVNRVFVNSKGEEKKVMLQKIFHPIIFFRIAEEFNTLSFQQNSHFRTSSSLSNSRIHLSLPSFASRVARSI